jgi:von Willebrand factor type A domain/Aerotolerance regulator N-terminal
MGALHLLDPKGLLLLAGLAPLVLLYILKIRRQRQRVPSTWLWAAAQRDLLAKHPFRKLIPEVPLILEILALLALAFALARPTSGGGPIDGDHVALVVDASASMATRVGGQAGPETRMDRAKRAAHEVVSHLGPGADAMLIEAGRQARVLSPPERDPHRLDAAIDLLSAREVEGDLTESLALAADRLRSLGGHGRVVLVTDGALASHEPLVVGGVTTDVIAVGDTEDNAGIVRIDVRSGIDGATHSEQVQVFVMIQSWGARPRDAYVTLTLEGRPEPVASRRLLLAPGDKQPVVLTFQPRPEDHGAGLTVSLSPGDAEPVDDAAYGRVPAAPRMPVTVVADAAATWTLRALEADPDVELRHVTPAALATVNIDPESLVVLEGVCPAVVPGGDVLVVAPPAGTCFGVGVGPAIDDPPLTSWEASDPRLRFLTLDGVHVAHAVALQARGADATLVRSTSATLVADASVPGRTVTLVGFDVGDSDWPLKASFVLFVRDIVEVARAHRLQGSSGPTRTGDPVRVGVPVGTQQVLVDGPGLPERQLAARDGLVTLPSPERAGLYHVRWTEPHVGGVVVAANLTSAAESDVRPRPLEIDGSPHGAPTPLQSTAGLGARGSWIRWLAALAAAALALDLVWVTRQPRRREASAR